MAIGKLLTAGGLGNEEPMSLMFFHKVVNKIAQEVGAWGDRGR